MSHIDLNCESGRLHGVLVEEQFVDISCRSRKCGKAPGVVVIHRFDTRTGECIHTRRYQEATITKGVKDATRNEGTALRSA